MKKIILILSVSIITFGLSSCQKDGSRTPTPTVKGKGKLKSLSAGGSFADLSSMYQSMDYEIRLAGVANMGLQSPLDDYKLTGSLPASYINYSVVLPTGQYDVNAQARNSEGALNQVTAVSNTFATLYGTDVTVSLIDNANTYTGTIYSPARITALKLGQTGSLEIPRTGNTLRWTVDQRNTTGVLLTYKLYSSPDITDPNKIVRQDQIQLADNGSYNIDQLIADPNIHGINIGLYRGNAMMYTNEAGKNIVMDIISTDFHYYTIQ